MASMKNMFIRLPIAAITLWVTTAASAVPLYDEDLANKSCAQLDAEISSLIPNTYSTKPDFYDDPTNILVANISLFVFEPAAHYLVYRESEKAGEQVKIRRYQDRVAELRLAKARKHCFE